MVVLHSGGRGFRFPTLLIDVLGPDETDFKGPKVRKLPVPEIQVPLKIGLFGVFSNESGVFVERNPRMKTKPTNQSPMRK